MLKYVILALILSAIVVGIWFYSLSGPQKLDLADRLYPGEAKIDGKPVTGIAFDNGERQQLDIYRPEGEGPHPVLIFYHGGSWYHGERAGYAFLGRAFATRGFVTVIADYRKYPQVKFPAFVEDAADAAAWVHGNIAEYGGDPGNIFLIGHSAGAHISMLAALDPQWLARKDIDSSIIKGVIGLAGPYDFLPFEEGGSAEKAMGEWPRPKETQPITYARGDAPPLLLLHGADDDLVGQHNFKNLSGAIEQAGGSAMSKLYPNIDHYEIIMAIARPFRAKAPVIEDAIAFMQGRIQAAETQ